MTRAGLILHHGGLYRCCVESAREWVDRSPHAVVTDGELIYCGPEGRHTMAVDMSLDGGAIRLLGLVAAGRMAFTCPRCGATSHNPEDAKHGWCGACHAVTRADTS